MSVSPAEDEQHDPGRDLNLGDLVLGQLVELFVVGHVPYSVGLVVGGVGEHLVNMFIIHSIVRGSTRYSHAVVSEAIVKKGEHLAIDVIELDEPRPLQALAFEQREACVGLASPGRGDK